ncbi:unnamed protein product, partial [Meganyctiphanes norvegica]
MSWLGGDDPGGGMGDLGDDDLWWAAEDGDHRFNQTWEERCGELDSDYHVVTAVICGMFLVFGVVYSLFGYRCFKAVMFLTGFIFACVVVYMICLSEALLPMLGNAGVALGAGIMFGLITMLVQYVGLFMTGLHTGLFLGVAGIAGSYKWWEPSSIWVVVGILLVSGLTMAILNLYFQKGLTILGTAISGGAIMAATMDYFIEKFLMVMWVRDRLKLDPSPTPCWFSWLILGIWPFMVVVGTLTQWRITGRGIYHQQNADLVQTLKSHKGGVKNMTGLKTRKSRQSLRQTYHYHLFLSYGAYQKVTKADQAYTALQSTTSPITVT